MICSMGFALIHAKDLMQGLCSADAQGKLALSTANPSPVSPSAETVCFLLLCSRANPTPVTKGSEENWALLPSAPAPWPAEARTRASSGRSRPRQDAGVGQRYRLSLRGQGKQLQMGEEAASLLKCSRAPEQPGCHESLAIR